MSAATVHVREARESDRPVVAALQGLLRSPAPGLADLAFGGAATMLVAERSSVVGYALAFPADGADARVVYLAELVVAPGARREGVGSRLLDALDERFADHDELRLTARADDERALAFYRAAGFWVLTELPGHYGDGDGLLLARAVGP